MPSKTVADIKQFVSEFHRGDSKIWVEEPETNFEKGYFAQKEFTTYRIMTKKVGSDPVSLKKKVRQLRKVMIL